MFYNELNKFNSLKPRQGCIKEKKVTTYENASETYNEFLEIYFDEYKSLPNAEKRELGNKYDSTNFFLEHITMISKRICWFIIVPPLEGDEKEVKEGKGLKTLTTSKL